MNATTAAFGTEAGLRLLLPPYPLTLDVAFRYLFLQPSCDGTVEATGQRVNINFAANSFTPLVRLAYHFWPLVFGLGLPEAEGAERGNT